MKNYNRNLVALAFGIAMAAALAGKLYAKSEYAQAAANNNVYGLSASSQCILGDPNNLVGHGCAVSMVGSPCSIIFEVNGVTEVSQAFKSPISVPFCALTLREAY